MLKQILCLSIILITQQCYSQVYSGRIVDTKTKLPIPNTEIYFLELDLRVQGDSTGLFMLERSINTPLIVYIRALGYHQLKSTISPGNTNQVFELESVHMTLDEVVISKSTGILQGSNVMHIETLKLKDANAIRASTMGELLTNIPGVYQTNTGMGISKPVIRGLSGVRIVSLWNGLRIENQQWGGDHGLGISDLGVSSVEVIKGPASLLYGADALGGVLYFKDNSFASKGTIDGYAQTMFESNTLGTNEQAGMRVAGENWKFNLDLSYQNHADSKVPDGKYITNTWFNDLGAKAAIGYSKNNWIWNTRYALISGAVGIPGESEDSIVSPDSFKSDQALRKRQTPSQGFTNHYLSSELKYYRKRAEYRVLIGRTMNSLKEFEENLDTASMNLSLNNSLYTINATFHLNEKLSWINGVQGMYQQNRNNEDAEEQIIPDADLFDNGVYSLLTFSSNKWKVQGGGRYDIRYLQTIGEFHDVSNFKRNYQSFNTMFGFVYESKASTYRVNFASGFRAPHMSELLADGEHHGALRYEIGDTILGSENARQIDVSYAYHSKHLELVINPFFNDIKNFIGLQQLQDSVVDGLPVFKYTQNAHVYLYGFDAGVHFHPHFAHKLHIEESLSILYGETKSGNSISLIPQPRLRSTFKFTPDMKSNFKIESAVLSYMMNFEQRNIGLNETASPFYHTMNFGLNFYWESNIPLHISTGIKNLWNEKYIDHLSRLKNIGLESQGRNVYLSVRYDFEKKLKTKKGE